MYIQVFFHKRKSSILKFQNNQKISQSSRHLILIFWYFICLLLIKSAHLPFYSIKLPFSLLTYNPACINTHKKIVPTGYQILSKNIPLSDA